MHSHPTTRRADGREGTRAGFLGATATWLWLLALDVAARSPLHTSGTLGRGLLGIILPGAPVPRWAAVLAFTLLHYSLWALLGRLVARAIRADARTPGMLVGAIVVLVMLQLAVVVVAAMLSQEGLHRLAWPAIIGGNAIGLFVTGAFLLWRHPEIPAELRRDSDA